MEMSVLSLTIIRTAMATETVNSPKRGVSFVESCRVQVILGRPMLELILFPAHY